MATAPHKAMIAYQAKIPSSTAEILVNQDPLIGELTVPDADLLVALKQAKLKKMFFAFIPKGTDGKLIVSKKKIPPKLIAEAKKEISGGPPVTGKCFGEAGTMVFEVAKPAAPTVTAAVKRVAKRETGLTIDPEFRLASDADAEETEDSGAGQALRRRQGHGPAVDRKDTVHELRPDEILGATSMPSAFYFTS
jgi:hypothetical protein